MGSVDGTSIHTDRLASTWRVNMKKKGSIKDGEGSKIGGSENPGKKYYSSLQSNL